MAILLDEEKVVKVVKFDFLVKMKLLLEMTLVFYIGYILDNKNTLCNGYELTGWSVLNSESSCIQKIFKSKHVTDRKLLEDVHEESLQIPSKINRFLCNCPDKPLKASGHPAVSSSLL
jgi:hypothetical protein